MQVHDISGASGNIETARDPPLEQPQQSAEGLDRQPQLTHSQDPQSAYLLRAQQERLNDQDGRILDNGLYVQKYFTKGGGLSLKEHQQGAQYAVYRPAGEGQYVSKQVEDTGGQRNAGAAVPTFWTPSNTNPPAFYRGKMTLN